MKGDFMAYETQMITILTHLKQYGSITSKQAIETYWITRLSEYIRALRRDMGWVIDDVWETNGDKRWKRYFFYPNKQINKI